MTRVDAAGDLPEEVDVEEFMEVARDVDNNGQGLTPWEINFVARLIDRPPKQPTSKQWDTLKRIQEERVR